MISTTARTTRASNLRSKRKNKITLIFTFQDVTTTTARYTKARKMEQTGTHKNNEAEDKEENKDTSIRVGDNATETTARITIHGRERTVSFGEEKVHGRSLRKSRDWNQDHGDTGEKETSQFRLWLKRLSSEMRRGMKMLYG